MKKYINYIKFAAVLVTALLLFGAGYQYAAALYKAKISDMVAEYEAKAREFEQDAKFKLQAERDGYAKATSELLAKLRESEDRQRDLAVNADRLRDELARRARLPSAGSSACRACEERLASCQGLLSDGVGLAEEGARLAERGAIRKDGLAAYSTQNYSK